MVTPQSYGSSLRVVARAVVLASLACETFHTADERERAQRVHSGAMPPVAIAWVSENSRWISR